MSNWDISIRSLAESQKVEFVEICNCHEPERYLRFDASEKKYYGESGCNKEFPCAKLQINKHQLEIIFRKQRMLNPHYNKKEHRTLKTPQDQTLDKFFGG